MGNLSYPLVVLVVVLAYSGLGCLYYFVGLAFYRGKLDLGWLIPAAGAGCLVSFTVIATLAGLLRAKGFGFPTAQGVAVWLFVLTMGVCASTAYLRHRRRKGPIKR